MNSDVSPNVKPKALKADTNSYFIEEGRFDCMSAVNSVPRDTDFFNDGLFRLEDDHLYGQMCQADFSQYIFSNPFENNVLGDLYRSTQTQKSPDHGNVSPCITQWICVLIFLTPELMPVSSFDIGLGQDSQPLCIRAFPGSGADNPFDTFEFGSSSSRESSGEPFNRASGCPCQQQALLVLEELEVRKQKTALQFADAMLVVRRRSLTVCEAMLSCERCPMVSSNTMLIILICEKMLATYQFSPGIDFENESSTPECAKGSIGKHSEILKRRVSLGVYQIDTKHEWARLVDLLTSIQLKRLQSLLIHLRAVVESAGPESLLSVVHAHEASLKEILQASPADFNVSASRVH